MLLAVSRYLWYEDDTYRQRCGEEDEEGDDEVTCIDFLLHHEGDRHSDETEHDHVVDTDPWRQTEEPPAIKYITLINLIYRYFFYNGRCNVIELNYVE